MSGNVIIFLRPDGGGGLGHVGWAYTLPDGHWLVGGLENPSGGMVVSAGQTGYWVKEVGNPGQAMANPSQVGAPHGTPAYREAKLIDVAITSSRGAYAKVQEWANRPYLVVGGNCMNCTYDIIVAYGAVVADPSTNPAPNNWFAALPGRNYVQ